LHVDIGTGTAPAWPTTQVSVFTTDSLELQDLIYLDYKIS